MVAVESSLLLPPSQNPAEVAARLDGWEAWLRGSDNLVHLERLAAADARTATLRRPLPDAVWHALGVGELWSHQAEALDLARSGRSVAVATGTGSGKSLIYQAAIAEAATAPVRPKTALLLFPTKALAQDQARALRNLGLAKVVPATYDGDASTEDRTWARNRANAVATNPEMLHHGILPHHRKWSTFFARLGYVVIDELHLLRGVFGSHVAHVLRRLRRVCAYHGSSPTFVFSSATIGAPGRLASDLSGLDVAEVTDDGSPRGERLFALWTPPVLGTDQRRAPASVEAAILTAGLVKEGHRTITFARSRKATELIASDIRRRLPRAWRDSIRSYRGGYLAEERRDIETELFAGELRGVVTTSALELGVDVSGLDACVLTGFPGTIASMWQQAGRAGRARQGSLAVLVAGDDQLDQWLVRHPGELFSRPPEPAVINASNPYVLAPHLECAANELPLTLDDLRFWGDDLDEGVRLLAAEDRLRIRRRGRRNEPVATWAGVGWPSHRVSLRSSSSHEITIRSAFDDRRIGTVDAARAPAVVHPGAVYLHRGVHYRVVELDLGARVATVEPADGETYTVARTSVDFRILGTDVERRMGRTGLGLGTVEVASQVTGFQRFDTRTRVSQGVTPLDLPPSVLRTRGIWYTVEPDEVVAAGVDHEALPGALHAVEHAAIGLLPLFAICDRWDVGGVSTACQADTGLPTVSIHDGYPGGAGIAELAFAAADRHLAETSAHIASCPCAAGCPSCVQSPKCGNGNEPLDKDAALRLLRRVC